MAASSNPLIRLSAARVQSVVRLLRILADSSWFYDPEVDEAIDYLQMQLGAWAELKRKPRPEVDTKIA